MNKTAIVKLLVGIMLVWSALAQILTHQTWWFIQNVNLIFHEAGHVLFMFFGRTLQILGGSLLEIFIPLSITLYFRATRQLFSAAVTSWWLATAFLSVSIYASDAEERLLPLITRDVSTHDWYNLLLHFGILHYDDVIGYLFWCLSLLSVVLLIFFIMNDPAVRGVLAKVLVAKRGKPTQDKT